MLNVFKTLEVQDQTLGRLLDEHAFLGFLQTAALVTVELVLSIQHLHGTARTV